MKNNQKQGGADIIDHNNLISSKESKRDNRVGTSEKPLKNIKLEKLERSPL